MSIFDHVTIRVSDFEKSERFFGRTLAALGIKPLFSVQRVDGPVAGYGRDGTSLFITGGKPLTETCHLAFRARSQAEVDAFHEAALSAGGQDNGAPGVRPKYHANYYAAYAIDPDGNNIEAVFHGTP
ncbi:VOC family protein [Brucella cytisi]|uniref:VOC family protein n=1 Tax=Brucella cytisi TaxID=407152 RepID=UPI0035D87FED